MLISDKGLQKGSDLAHRYAAQEIARTVDLERQMAEEAIARMVEEELTIYPRFFEVDVDKVREILATEDWAKLLDDST